VIVEEVQMAARQSGNLRQRSVDTLRVKRAPAGEERVLVAEIAVHRASASDDDRVRNEIEAPLDQIAADGRNLIQRSAGGRLIHAARMTAAEVLEKLRERLLTRAEEDGVRVMGRLLREGSHVQSTERDESTPRAIRVGQPIRAIRVGDVDLNDDEVRTIVGGQGLDVLVDEHRLVVGPQVRGKRREAKRREKRILDRPPEGTCRLGQCRKDELDAQGV
jgi:hypothetical protein